MAPSLAPTITFTPEVDVQPASNRETSRNFFIRTIPPLRANGDLLPGRRDCVLLVRRLLPGRWLRRWSAPDWLLRLGCRWDDRRLMRSGSWRRSILVLLRDELRCGPDPRDLAPVPRRRRS